MLDKPYTCLDHNGIAIKIVIGSLIGRRIYAKTPLQAYSATRSYWFFASYLVLSLIRPIVGHHLSVTTTGFLPLRKSY